MAFTNRTRFKFFVIFNLIIIIISASYPAYANYNEKGNLPINQESFINLNFNHYYYNKLNSIEKLLYDNLIESQEKLLDGKEVIFDMTSYDKEQKLDFSDYTTLVRRVRKAYTYDNPKFDIWFDNYECLLSRSQEEVYIIFRPKEENLSNIKQEIEKFDSISSDFVSTLSGTEIQKLKQIHDWLITHAVYDYTLSLPNTRTAYGTIVQGRSVCSGFAYAYKHLADLSGLNVLYVVGKLYNKQENAFYPHAWNIVNINGEYFIVDVTLDSTSSDESKYKFFLSPINDGIHYADTYYFDYEF